MGARTGRTLGILSDARYRFERGLDPQSAAWGVEVAARLILEICGGAASAVVSAGEIPTETRRLGPRPSRVAALGGQIGRASWRERGCQEVWRSVAAE